MRIVRAENAGFCFGVKRAMKLAFEAAASRKLPIYTFGPLIHNPQQVRVLADHGVYEVSDLEPLEPGDTLIIRSHGTCPEVIDRAKEKGLNVIDATCPFVVKAQELSRCLAEEGYQVVIVGESQHPEVIGLIGFAGKGACVVENAESVQALAGKKKIGIVVQTTQSLNNLREVVSAFLELTDELKVFNTICNATALRQEAALNIAREVDLMVVIGGYNSANTNRLASLCAQLGVPTQHIETADELEASWLEGIHAVGVTAGASTPDWIIEGVVEKLEALSKKNS